MGHPNEELVRKGYTAFLSGDMTTMDQLLADDVVWHSPGRNQLAGTFTGKPAVFENFQKVFELTGGTFKLEIHDVLANDEHAVVLVRATGEKDGRKLDKIVTKVLSTEFSLEPDSPLPLTVKGSELKPAESKGELLFDRELGQVVSSASSIQIVGELTLVINNMELPSKLDLKIETSMQPRP